MRALLTPEIARGMGIVLLRPGPELMHIFANGRVLVEVQPESMVRFPSGAVPPAHQPLADDEGLQVFFTDERVIRAAGGVNALEHWLMKQQGGCQWPHSEYHHHEMTTMRHEPGALRLCWHCDNQLAEHFTERLSAIARSNVIAWIISVARGALAFDDTHELTLPELCWWAVRMDIGLSPIYAAGLAAMQGHHIQENAAFFFRNGGKPSGVIEVPGSISEENARILKNNWDTGYTGENAGKTAILSNGAKYNPTAMTAADAQMVEQLQMTAKIVCSVFHVPAYKAGNAVRVGRGYVAAVWTSDYSLDVNRTTGMNILLLDSMY